jgi:hypothetical protein
LKADEPLATPASVVNKVGAAQWKDKLGANGPGVTLDELALLIPGVLQSFGVGQMQVHVMRFADSGEGSIRRLRRLLEGAVGHIWPVGAYDADAKRVLIFDPDRQWYEPYWTPDETLLQAMNTKDPVSGRARGLVHVSLRVGE